MLSDENVRKTGNGNTEWKLYVIASQKVAY